MTKFNRIATSRRSMARRAAGFILVASVLLPITAISSTRGDRVSRISNKSSASEYWDIVARFDSNYSLFARFLITNRGPGDNTAIATWYLVDPDGKTTAFQNGRREKSWTRSADGARLEIGSSVFDQSGSIHSLAYDSTKRGIRVDLQFSPDSAVAWTDAMGASYSIDLLDLGTAVSGTIWLKGMAKPTPVRGSIAITHTWMDPSEAKISLRRIEFLSSSDESALYLSDLTTPSGEHHRWLVLQRKGEVIYQSSDFQLDLQSDPTPRKAGYPIPRVLRIRGPGLQGTIDTGRVLTRANPLESVPQPFRLLLSFSMRPHRVWTDASFEGTLRTDPAFPAIQLRSTGITITTFLNPLPPKISRFPVRVGSSGG